MKSVLISINPKWVAKIASGEKTVEVRKSYPHCEFPFKCYIYCTNDPKCLLMRDERDGKLKVGYNGNFYHHRLKMGWNCKVVGEFVCNGIDEFIPSEKGIVIDRFLSLHETCLKVSEMRDYLKDKKGYGWRISDLKIYDEPKELSDFIKPEMPTGLRYEDDEIKRPPQSWQFVEEKV